MVWSAVRTAARFARDLVRSRAALAAENAFLRQQLQVALRPRRTLRPTRLERGLLATLSRLFDWRGRKALVAFSPDTLVRWHRQGFRIFWRAKSRPRPGRPKLRQDRRALIEAIAVANPRMGAKKIVGQLRRAYGIRVHKRTVQRILKELRPRRPPPGQSMKTFLANHADGAWACDFFSVPTLGFKQLYVLFFLELRTRRIVHWAVTSSPTGYWTTAQAREATPWGEGPGALVRDRDAKYVAAFDNVFGGAKIVATTACGNPYAERFVQTIKRELTDHLVPINEGHLSKRVGEYVSYYNRLRPHQSLEQRAPTEDALPPVRGVNEPVGPVVVTPVLNGLVQHFAPGPVRLEAA